ncbi:hypothetical protein C8Q77DRAFT_813694 [Trametes polyzona]|nr:hypothetical protein C8Q77DRAFT_813694 [Trametes polyzona]
MYLAEAACRRRTFFSIALWAAVGGYAHILFYLHVRISQRDRTTNCEISRPARALPSDQPATVSVQEVQAPCGHDPYITWVSGPVFALSIAVRTFPY